jgi:thiol-disulfide isomerase/thioredoxin
MTEVESNTFDDVIKQAKEKELLPHFKLSEVHSLERSVGEGGNWAEKVNTSKSVNGTGAISHIEKLRELAKPFEEHFSFEFVLGKGDKLPKYENVGKVFEEGKVSLEHKPGEVMLIDVWATWCGPCQKPMQHNQDMLEKNAEAWKDKVRIVAVSVDDNLDAVKKRVE